MAVVEQKNMLDPFEFHGVVFGGESGNQSYAACPFCAKPKHFYVNNSNGLWDCKVCLKKGNVSKFLEYMGAKCAAELKGEPLSLLVESRGIPSDVLRKWGIGWNGKRYTMPVRDTAGHVVDLRVYKLGEQLLSTKGCKTGLFGAHKIKPGKGKIYVCEGEWDAMALDALASKLGHQAQIVGVPGAGTFKQEWTESFKAKDVITLYDNDTAGEDGERVALGRLRGVASSIKFIHWPSDAPSGFDVRDWVCYGIRIGKAEGSWTNIHKLLENNPRKATPEEKASAHAVEERTKKGTATAAEVFKVYSKWLKLDEPDVLKVLFGTCFANRLDGEPVWMFLVAPPGGMKSELLMSLKEHPSIYSTTSLTPHTLVSGAYAADGKDPSLLPLLDGKILSIKDFTTILTMHYSMRDEIFGIFRDVYDGSTGKNFGTGVRREYNVKFGILAGVTNKIEAYGAMHQSLGERFLKFRASEDKRESEEDKIRRALGNTNREVAMRTELCEVAARHLDREMPAELPVLSNSVTERLIALARYTAILRGVVERDRFDKTVLYRPSYEVGTRLAKQLSKLGIGIAIHLGHNAVADEEFRIIRRVAIDTAPDRIEIIVRKLFQACPNKSDALRTQKVADLTRLPQATIFRVLQDLELLQIVDRTGDGQKHVWKLNNKVEALIGRAGIYGDLNRASLNASKPSKPVLRIPVRA